MSLEWFDGSLTAAATSASTQKLVLLVCILDEANAKEVEKATKLSSVSAIQKLAAEHCLCVRLVRGTDDEKQFSRLYPVPNILTVYFIHQKGNFLLSGNDVTEENITAAILQNKNSTVDAPVAQVSMAKLKKEEEIHWQTREAERLRKQLLKQKKKDSQYIKQLRRDIEDDRMTYQNIHGKSPAPTPPVSPDASVEFRPSMANSARILFRLSNGQAVSSDFAADVKFKEVRAFLEQKLDRTRSNIEVTQSMPRAVLGDDADSQTLAALKLAPSATWMLAERDSVYDKRDRAKKHYDSSNKNLATSKQKLERAETDADKHKFRRKTSKNTGARNQAKNEYILQVAVANRVKNAIHHKFSSRLMDTLQISDDQRTVVVKHMLEDFFVLQESMAKDMTENIVQSIGIAKRIETEREASYFIKKRIESGKSNWVDPPDFGIVVDPETGDSDQMALDGESQAVLRNLCLQAKRECARAEFDAQRDKQKEAEKYANVELTNERRLALAASAVRKEIVVELEIIQHEALAVHVEQQIGPVDSGNPHDFVATTVTFSKTCDYCNESISGLNRKAFKCGECEYICHTSCQIKVLPKCPGRDLNVKTGFLSIFKKRRGGLNERGSINDLDIEEDKPKETEAAAPEPAAPEADPEAEPADKNQKPDEGGASKKVQIVVEEEDLAAKPKTEPGAADGMDLRSILKNRMNLNTEPEPLALAAKSPTLP
ncbi:Protein BZZ1, partial [Coemansia interrupta]